MSKMAPARVASVIFDAIHDNVATKSDIAPLATKVEAVGADVREQFENDLILEMSGVNHYNATVDLCIRLKDNGSDLRENFAGLRWYPVAEDWKVVAKFVPHPFPSKITFDTIIGEQVLGLPPEPRVDTDRPWTEIPR